MIERLPEETAEEYHWFGVWLKMGPGLRRAAGVGYVAEQVVARPEEISDAMERNEWSRRAEIYDEARVTANLAKTFKDSAATQRAKVASEMMSIAELYLAKFKKKLVEGKVEVDIESLARLMEVADKATTRAVGGADFNVSVELLNAQSEELREMSDEDFEKVVQGQAPGLLVIPPNSSGH